MSPGANLSKVISKATCCAPYKRMILRRVFKPCDNEALRDNIRQAFSHYWPLHDMDKLGEDYVAQTEGANLLSYG